LSGRLRDAGTVCRDTDQVQTDDATNPSSQVSVESDTAAFLSAANTLWQDDGGYLLQLDVGR
jgi:hypothetical protein